MRKIYLICISVLVAASVSAQSNNDIKPRTHGNREANLDNSRFVDPPTLNAPGCDTLLWSTNTISTFGGTAYVVDFVNPVDSGFISGLNAYNDLQKGNRFNVSGTSNSNYVTGFRVGIAKAKSSDMSKTVAFRVYEMVGSTWTAVGGASAPLSALTAYVGAVATLQFPTPIQLTSSKDFIISVDMSNLSFAANDSFFLYQNSWTTSNGKNAPDSAYEQWSTGTWAKVSSSWGTPATFFYLFPLVSDNATCTLPVTMGGLNASQLGMANQLKWSTKTEIGNKGFEIQRSSDGNLFTTIAFVASKAPLGNSSQTINYEFTDNSPNASANYYRIKQVDNNGKPTFSNIALLNRALANLKGIITFYPNPVKSMLNLQLAGSVEGNDLLTITNMNGVTVLQQAIHTTGSLQNVNINVSRLPVGAYIVRLNGEARSAKFIKE